MQLFNSILLLSASFTLVLTGCAEARKKSNSQFDQTFQKIRAIVLEGDYEKAMPLYRQAADDAKAQNLPFYRVNFLSDLGNCQFMMYQFHAALQTMEESRELAKQIGDRRDLAKIDSNMSALFLQIGNLEEAANVAEEALAYADGFGAEPAQRALLYGQLGVIRGKQHQLDRAEVRFKQAIETASKAHEERALAMNWDTLAYARLEAGEYPLAEEAVKQALELRQHAGVGGIDSSYMILGRVRAGEGDLKGALGLLSQAEAAVHLPRSVTPPWWIYLRRGQIRLQAGDLKPALDDLLLALDSAREWRADVPPNDANRTSSEEMLAELYQSLVEAGNRLYLQNHDSSLIRMTFEAVEENRAASLRALIPQQNDWRKHLPSHYYELLSRLQALQADQMRRGASPSPVLLKLRSDLAAIEANAGGSPAHRSGRALSDARKALDGESVLLSFELGERVSWLWVVTKDQINVHALPARQQLADEIKAFARAVGTNAGDLRLRSASLYHALFGSVETNALARERWLLTLDGELFDLPFAALSATTGRFLVEDHSLQVVPGALMLNQGGYRPHGGGGFLAVGDPIYNQADPRAVNTKRWPWAGFLSRAGYQHGPAFARLWGTGREIEVAARTWNAPVSTLLTGKQVSPELFWKETLNKPEIIHIATHILEENEKPQTGWIAFSLGTDGEIQYITPEDILAKSIAARLVVLSGCSSGKADIQAATGLMGLTRAWLAAGAGSVLATRWPTVDDDGAFFESFYRNLRQIDAMKPADALRNASLEMLKSGTWRAAPSFWAGYFLIGNY